MALIVVLAFMAIAVLALFAYGGTPHSGPATTCGPINVFGNHFTLTADCRYVSAAEIAIAAVFFALAVFIALSARPRP